MASPKTAKPATARHGEPVSKIEQLGSGLDPTNNPKPAGSQAPPDDAGLSDFDWFRRHAGARQRLRMPFDAELPVEVWQAAVDAGLAGFVIVKRGPPGSPWIRSRQFVFAAGGMA